MGRLVIHAQIAAKKKSLHASERIPSASSRHGLSYQEAVAALDPQRFKFIDESGVNLAMTRLYGRAPRGERVIGTVPQNYGANVTMLAALGSHGVEAVMTIDGATDAEVFRVYVDQVLRPTLCPGDIVIMDNLRAHKAVGIREAMEQAGAWVLYLPPYSPDLARHRALLVEAQNVSCARLRPARVRHWMRPSLRRWPASPPRMHEVGSSIVAMPYSNSRTALCVPAGPSSLKRRLT